MAEGIDEQQAKVRSQQRNRIQIDWRSMNKLSNWWQLHIQTGICFRFLLRSCCLSPDPLFSFVSLHLFVYWTSYIKAGFVFWEEQAPGLSLEMTLKKIKHSTNSEFQQIDVIETFIGKMLVRVGSVWQIRLSWESDAPGTFEFCHYNGSGPKTVLIGGGRELATAREVLRYTSVEKCFMVDLDGTYWTMKERERERWIKWRCGCRFES